MVNPSGLNAGHQWIELYNPGDKPISLTAKDVRLVDRSGSHLIKSVNGGTDMPAGSVAIIVENPDLFWQDVPNYAGALFKSAFSLPAEGSLSIRTTEGNSLAEVTYANPDAAEGNSLQLFGGSYVAGASTPGVVANPVPASIAAPQKSAKTAKAPKTPTTKKMKPGTRGSSSKKRATAASSSALTDSAYDPGMIAPAAPAIAGAAGALSILHSRAFGYFLAVLAIAVISVIIFIRHV